MDSHESCRECLREPPGLPNSVILLDRIALGQANHFTPVMPDKRKGSKAHTSRQMKLTQLHALLKSKTF